jgi:hypothetical protein
MTKATETAKNKVVDAITKEATPLRGTDYYEYLEELASFLDGLMEGYREENPEEFS